MEYELAEAADKNDPKIIMEQHKNSSCWSSISILRRAQHHMGNSAKFSSAGKGGRLEKIQLLESSHFLDLCTQP